MQYSEISSLADRILDNIDRVMIGKRPIATQILAAILSSGHVLLEDVPGTGKTTLAKAFALSFSGQFSRIQCTPDVLPSDITGMTIFHQENSTFEFLPGPVFTNILLVDEINRATPRTQSALLEAMQEGQVSENSKTYPLPDPFLVIATENPVESQGTFPLPEAQLDRFMMQLTPGYPDHAEAIQMLRSRETTDPLAGLSPVASLDELTRARALCRSCAISDDLLDYLARICEAARDPALVFLGPSPRAMLMLMTVSKAYAAIQGRDYVLPDDIKAFVVPVLGHRILMQGSDTPAQFLAHLLDTVPVPTEVTQ